MAKPIIATKKDKNRIARAMLMLEKLSESKWTNSDSEIRNEIDYMHEKLCKLMDRALATKESA